MREISGTIIVFLLYIEKNFEGDYKWNKRFQVLYSYFFIRDVKFLQTKLFVSYLN